MMMEIGKKKERKLKKKMQAAARRPSALDRMDGMMMAAETRANRKQNANEDLESQMTNGENKFGWGPKSNYKPGGGGVSYMQRKRQSDVVAPLKPLNNVDNFFAA